ncbi:hypothetical protein Q8W33_11940 [Shimia thalassica]|nr:hypothetical protein [Shimia thalassica]
MEYLKEIYEAWGARVKSNLLGSVVLSFLAINWKVFFYLVFADRPVLQKFRYFDANTDNWSLFVSPILVGGAIALGLPFLNNLTHRVVSAPISRIRSRDEAYSHERLSQRNEWEVERNRAIEIFEKRLVAAAQIDQEIENTIEDEDVKEKLRKQIEEQRVISDTSKSDQVRSNSFPDTQHLKKIERYILRLLDRSGLRSNEDEDVFSVLTDKVQSQLISDLTKWNGYETSSLRASIEFNDTFKSLANKGLVVASYRPDSPTNRGGRYHFKLTPEGYRVLDAIRKEEDES